MNINLVISVVSYFIVEYEQLYSSQVFLIKL